MDNKIFLGKYRVSAEEISTVGELTDTPLAYEGEEVDSGKKVVVEAVPAASLKMAVREQLEAEAIAAKKLSHVNVPALYDFGVEEDHLVYVTEDFEGTLAEEWVNTHGPMPVGPVLRIASQVVSALGAAAFHRIVHYAINPSNLVLVPGQTAEGEWPLVKVLHFVGIAPAFSGTDVSVAAIDKALHYASPEQLQQGAVDFRSEIYSLGCTMWFLLTGAPPLTPPSAPMATPPAKTGPAADMTGIPKKVRRLLAQMLSVDPDARPRDPLAFYRELQDCLAQVERRETLSRKFGVPVISTTGAVVSTRRRRSPMKALALAALFLALAAVTALVLSGYLRHRRVVRAEEPIGVPIGVPDAFASATPASANAPTAITSNTTPPTTLADSSSTQSAPAERAESEKPVATDSVESTAASQVAPAPVAPATPAPEVNPPTQEPAPVAANNASSLPAAIDSSPIADDASTPPARTDSSAVAAISQVEAAPAESPPGEAVTQESEKVVMREVRRGELVEEPEVRRAEPPPPEEGPAEVASDTTATPEEEAKPVTQPEENKNGDVNKPETTAVILKRTDSKPKVAKSPEKKTRQTAKSKRRSDDRTHPSQPMASMRARFVGVTEDGRWMFVLPSNKIIIVPPPPSYP